MRRHAAMLFAAALVAATASCGGYGDESGSVDEGPPPLIGLKDVNAWLQDYHARFQTEPSTYEELKSLYEQSGKKWPRFPSGGSWVYFPHQVRMTEVSERRVRDYLKFANSFIEGTRRWYSAASAEAEVRRKAKVSVHMPGYIVDFQPQGSGGYFALKTDDSGAAIRGNHTAGRDFEIDSRGLVVAVPSSSE